MTSTLSFSTIVVAGHVHFLGLPGNINQTWLSLYACFERPGATAATVDPFSALVYNLRNVSVVMRFPNIGTFFVKPDRK